MTQAEHDWQQICPLERLLPNTGVCARVNGHQIAIFRLGDGSVRAVDQWDPWSQANVLARGIVGDIEGEAVVASPIYKQHFSLTTGRCLEDPGKSIRAYEARVLDGQIWLDARPKRRYISLRHAPERAMALVVVGNGMAAIQAIEKLQERDPNQYSITVFDAEPHGHYHRIGLSAVLAGRQPRNALDMRDAGWYAERGITLHRGDPVVQIDRGRRIVISAAGKRVAYDRLILATGAVPSMPDWPGADLEGVTTYRSMDDVDYLIEVARDKERAVVVGGGALGLEAAYGLCVRGMAVTLVHRGAQLLDGQLDATAAEMLKQQLEDLGIQVRLRAELLALEGDQGRVERVRIAGSPPLDTDVVVVAVGVQPNIALAAEAGLACHRGIIVSDTLQSFDPRIYAIGECIEHRGTCYGLHAPHSEQAGICAMQLAGESVRGYRGSVAGMHLQLGDTGVYSTGLPTDEAETEDLVMHDPRRGLYRRLTLRDNRIVGAMLVGAVDDGPWYFDLLRARVDISAMRSRLLFGEAYCEEEAA
ncbi:MAG: nitrite reductase small subunit NirD [Algiphilus sp.]